MSTIHTPAPHAFAVRAVFCFFLIGLRGSGKSTVGRVLADMLDWAFADTDALVVQKTGMSIAQIVAAHGWDYFRQEESAALREAVASCTLLPTHIPHSPTPYPTHAPHNPHSMHSRYTIIATGGGVVLAPANVIFMREYGLVVYLCADAATLAARLTAQPEHGQRPSLTGKPLVDEIADVLRERDALYREAAHLVLDATLPVQDVACAIRDY